MPLPSLPPATPQQLLLYYPGVLSGLEGEHWACRSNYPPRRRRLQPSAESSGLRIQQAPCPWDPDGADGSQIARHRSHWQSWEPGGHGDVPCACQASVQG